MEWTARSEALYRGAAVVMCVLTLAGCARPVGDFGRAEPSVLHDRIMPGLGSARAGLVGDPVSGFVPTDEEREMHDRVWRFLIAPHADDWFYDIAVEWQRTELTGATDINFSPDRYYAHLRAANYQSSPIRYRTITHDIDIDIATLPTTFAAICAVIEIDRRRAVALQSVADPGPEAAADVAARRAENSARIAWFTRALRYRHLSYATALQRLLVETPHEESRLVPPRLEALEAYVLAAESGAFCVSGHSAVIGVAAEPVPSRFETEPVLDLPPK